MAGRKAQLSCCFLLQGRRRKGRLRVAGNRFGFNRIDRKMTGFNRAACGLSVALGTNAELFKLFAFVPDQAAFKALPLMIHLRGDGPIFLCPESFDFALPLDNQAQRYRLHTPG